MSVGSLRPGSLTGQRLLSNKDVTKLINSMATGATGAESAGVADLSVILWCLQLSRRLMIATEPKREPLRLRRRFSSTGVPALAMPDKDRLLKVDDRDNHRLLAAAAKACRLAPLLRRIELKLGEGGRRGGGGALSHAVEMPRKEVVVVAVEVASLLCKSKCACQSEPHTQLNPG